MYLNRHDNRSNRCRLHTAITSHDGIWSYEWQTQDRVERIIIRDGYREALMSQSRSYYIPFTVTAVELQTSLQW